MIQRLPAWQLSVLIHAAVVASFFALLAIKIPDREAIEVPIVVNEPPKEIQNLSEVKEKPKVVLRSVNEPMPEVKPVREVFGANRNSYTDESLGDEGIAAKKGNTLAKASDQTKLEDYSVQTYFSSF